MQLIAELRRRNVFRMAGLYLVGAWLVVQIAETLLPIFHTPDWVLQSLVVLLALGFLPALVFSWVFELTPEGLKRDAEVPAEQSIAAHTGRRMDRLILVGLLAVAALVIGDRYWPREAPAASVPVTGEEAAAGGNSIAVLPFVNMSEDSSNEYFSDGISEEILNVLAGVPELQVAARTSSFSFKGKDKEIPEIADALNVRLILEGSVRKQGERVRITAQLIDAPTGFHLWSQTYDRDLQDIFAIQDEIAKAIGDELKVKVGGATGQVSGTQDLKAYDLYLQGMAHWHTRREDDLWAAVDLFEKAAAADPGFAEAFAGLALTYSVISAYSSRISYEESEVLTRNMGLRALAIDATQPEAYAALGMLSNDGPTSEALLRRAVALRPSFATAHQWLGTRLTTLGRLEEGVQELEKATALDPRAGIIADNHAFVLLTLGRAEDARTLCEAAIAINSDENVCYLNAGMASLELGDFEAARTHLGHLAVNVNPSAAGQPDAIVAALSGQAGKAALGRQLAALPFNSNVIQGSGNVLEDHMVALLLVMLDEPALAMDYIERISGYPGNTMDWAIMLPALDPIRCEPRFKGVVARMKTTDPHAATVCAGK